MCMPPKGSPMIVDYSWCRKRKVEADFIGGAVTSDAGALLLREADRRIGMTRALGRVVPDTRRRRSCEHSVAELLRQRIYSIALGYEDLNDQEALRRDPCIQTAIGKDTELASASTLCRFENSMGREAAWAVSKLLVEQFIASFDTPPEELILDFDATDDRVHGEQEGRYFHGYYNSYCFLPLYVFCGEQLLVSYLRSSNQDGARHSGAILRLLVTRLREAWPDVKITYRADSGFCRWRTLRWCERHDVFYVIGMAKNKRLLAAAAELIAQSERLFTRTGEKQRLFSTFNYAAAAWDRERRIIIKAEHSRYGSNPRFIVTNRRGCPQKLYDTLYCARGEMENRIKECQLHLFADRTSCSKWWPNQFRLLLSSLAYTLVESIRRLALAGTELAKAQAQTIRLKLFKIGAVVLTNTKRIRLKMSSYYPYKELFALVAARLRVT